jgi:Tfp pilus assembly protein PilX
MRLPRVRFTMRRMMVVVAVIAMVMGTVAGLQRRRESFERRAQMFARRASAAIMDEQAYRTSRRSNRPGSPFYYDNRTTGAYSQLVEHYDALRVKYERAAARPWRFVATDPPEPPWPKDVQRR